MIDFHDDHQHQEPFGELGPRMTIGLYGAPNPPYVPADPSAYPEDVQAALAQTNRKPGRIRAFLRRLFHRR